MNDWLKERIGWVVGLALVVPTSLTQYTTNKVLTSVDGLGTSMVEVRKDIQHSNKTLEIMQTEQGKHRSDIEDLKLRIALIERDRQVGGRNVN